MSILTEPNCENLEGKSISSEEDMQHEGCTNRTEGNFVAR